MMKSRRRFYLPGDLRRHRTVVLDGQEAHHLQRVLRMRPGEELVLLDGSGAEFPGRIKGFSGSQVIVELETAVAGGAEPSLTVSLAQGIPKGDKMELIIQKATELGLSRLVPLMTARTVVRLRPERSSNRIPRWQRVAAESAKQCRRSRPPRIDPVCTLKEALEQVPRDALALMPWEGEGGVWLKDQLRGENLRKRPEIWIFVGPEGGWEPAEVELAQSAGVIPVTLGPRILRTETAALAMLSILMYEGGDLGEAEHGR